MGLILSVLLYAAALVTAGSVVFGYVGFFVYGTIISFPVCFPVFLGAVAVVMNRGREIGKFHHEVVAHVPRWFRILVLAHYWLLWLAFIPAIYFAITRHSAFLFCPWGLLPLQFATVSIGGYWSELRIRRRANSQCKSGLRSQGRPAV